MHSSSLRPIGAALALGAAVSSLASAQSVSPTSITSISGATCSGGSETYDVSITLPPSSNSGRVDVFLLFDDTGSFADEAPEVIAAFTRVVAFLQAAIPTADIAYGVGRFEDYGGPGADFGGGDSRGRPFFLNQAILSRSNPDFVASLSAALANVAPANGGDGPESSAGEALFQVAMGAGFDGNGNGSTLDSGLAGSLIAQTAPGTSGDVPPFASYVGSSSGDRGGVGFREDSLRIVILATDICSISPFDSSAPIPATITGTGSVEPTTAFSCSTVPGVERYGFVSDALSNNTNTVSGAVAPRGSATLPQSIAALNAAGIRVIGLAPNGRPLTDTGPSTDPSVMLSALARLTGAVDDSGTPLVFDITSGDQALANAIVDAVESVSSSPLDIELVSDGMPTGLSTIATPSIQMNVAPGETANFSITFDASPAFTGGEVFLRFRDLSSGAVFGTIPARFTCTNGCFVVDFETDDDLVTPLVNGQRIDIGEAFGTVIDVSGQSVSGFTPAIFNTDAFGPNAASSDQDLLVGSGNALILQENDAESSPGIYSDPDDDLSGGSVTFSFASPTTLCSIDLIDIDMVDVQEAQLVMTDEANLTRTYRVPGGFTEDITQMAGTGVRTLDLAALAPQAGFLTTATSTEQTGFNSSRVTTLRINLFGSGAIDNLAFIGPNGILSPGLAAAPNAKLMRKR